MSITLYSNYIDYRRVGETDRISARVVERKKQKLGIMKNDQDIVKRKTVFFSLYYRNQSEKSASLLNVGEGVHVLGS